MHIVYVILEFAVVLGIMVLVHEFGHFAVAKLCGVRVETFSIGFGPRLFGWRHGDTDYRVSLLPLGGYVKMAGDAPGSEPEEGSWNTDEFNAHPRWQRVLIALAGPAANFILSFFLLALVAHYHYETAQYLSGPAVVDYVPLNTSAAKAGLATGDVITRFGTDANPTWSQILYDCALDINRDLPITFNHNGAAHTGSIHVITGDDSKDFNPSISMAAIGLLPRMQNGPLGVKAVSAGSPGDEAGLKAGDSIARVDNLDIHSVDTLLAYLKDRNGAPADILVQRAGQPISMHLVPEYRDNGLNQGHMSFQIGFRPLAPPANVQRLPLGAAMAQSVRDNIDDSKLILRVLKGMFTRHVAVSSLSGPVGIAQEIDTATQMGFWTLLSLMSNISINLGIFNLLPLPILDGGMIVFLVIESIMRRDVNLQIKERVYQAAFVCFILFACFVLFNDITKLHIGH